MKALIILLLAIAVFGSGGYFAYELLVKPEVALRTERQSQATRPPPTPPPDISLPDYEKVMALVLARPDEAAPALEAFVEHYPNSPKAAAVKKKLGQVNVDRFFTVGPGPGKVHYVVKSGDAIAKIERRFNSNAELIMRTNNLLDPTRLKIGQELWVPQPDFILKIDRPTETLTLFNRGRFFKQYVPLAWRAPKPAKGAALTIKSRVLEKIAWKNGTRVAFGSKEYAGSLHWVSIATAGFTLYAEPATPDPKLPRPSAGLLLAPGDSEELSVLVNRNTPVLIE